VSMIPILTPRPVLAPQAAGKPISLMFHCWGQKGSFGAAGVPEAEQAQASIGSVARTDASTPARRKTERRVMTCVYSLPFGPLPASVGDADGDPGHPPATRRDSAAAQAK